MTFRSQPFYDVQRSAGLWCLGVNRSVMFRSAGLWCLGVNRSVMFRSVGVWRSEVSRSVMFRGQPFYDVQRSDVL